MSANSFNGKRVLITGHTGFKGSWLAMWLIKLGAEVYGISDRVPTSPSMFEDLSLAQIVNDSRIDVRDLSALREKIQSIQPDFIFHLAAQAIVSISHEDPVATFTTNTIGTMNILEVLRCTHRPCTVVLITSDKVYDNLEWVWGYRESDGLGGKDIYSGSKAAAELIIKSYIYTYFDANHPVKISIARAGNVIGGGDWAKDRIVADCMRSWISNQPVIIRSPWATRPWQHVLEPLSGYLLLADKLQKNKNLHGEAFNFGPQADQNFSVEELLRGLALKWGFDDVLNAYVVEPHSKLREAQLLKLNCDKAHLNLGWKPRLNFDLLTSKVSDWYSAYVMKNENMFNFTMTQIAEYEDHITSKKILSL